MYEHLANPHSFCFTQRVPWTVKKGIIEKEKNCYQNANIVIERAVVAKIRIVNLATTD